MPDHAHRPLQTCPGVRRSHLRVGRHSRLASGSPAPQPLLCGCCLSLVYHPLRSPNLDRVAGLDQFPDHERASPPLQTPRQCWPPPLYIRLSRAASCPSHTVPVPCCCPRLRLKSPLSSYVFSMKCSRCGFFRLCFRFSTFFFLELRFGVQQCFCYRH